MVAQTVDFKGARGSNAGDVFHELWAVREALRLLDPDDDLKSIEVEGVSSDDGSDWEWEGVDCALFFGGEGLANASRVDLQQLKYSSADPDKNWTVSRLASKNGRPKGEGSVIRRLGDAFKRARSERPDLDSSLIKVSLITNQPTSPELEKLFEDARTSVPEFSGEWQSGASKLHRLVEASGLTSTEFKDFANCFEFGKRTRSRFGLEEEMLREIAQWADAEFSEIALRLRKFVRDRMLPEATGHNITRQAILFEFGVSDSWALFPCEPKLAFPAQTVPREIVSDVTSRLTNGDQRLCLHGAGGVGKTTILAQLESQLPPKSELIVYDCYGEGTYLEAGSTRHHPDQAFVQLANELARRLRLPSLLERKTSRDLVRSFRSRLDIAANALASRDPTALLVIVIDAADNAVRASNEQMPPEPCFVGQIASFGDLPLNVRIIISCRSGRIDTLALPETFAPIELSPFTEEETTLFVNLFWKGSSEWIEDFHHLSGGVARVQNYAFQQVGDDHEKALEHLRPNGKTLPEVFDVQFREAVRKSGASLPVERVCAGLIALPRPIPLSVIAPVLEVSAGEIEDICNDLSPGVRNQAGFLGFADEDFEEFVRERAASQIDDVRTSAAKFMLSEYSASEYAALHVSQLLFDAGLTVELLDLVEDQASPPDAVISDPVRRQETSARRLLTALRACREAGDTLRALRFVLIGVEGRNTENSIRELLIRFPRLAARYARESSGRMILSDSELIEKHGPHLLQRLAVEADADDRVGARETRRQLAAWFDRRLQDYRDQEAEGMHARAWELSADEFASAAIARAKIEGVENAISLLSKQRSFGFRCDVSKLVIDRLLAEQRFDLIEAAVKKLPAWLSIYPTIRLATTGRDVDLRQFEFGIKQLLRRWPLSKFSDDGHFGYDGRRETTAEYVNMMLEAAELLIMRNESEETARLVFSCFLEDEFRRKDKLYESDTTKIDAIIRSLSVLSLLDKEEFKSDSVLTNPPITEKKSSDTGGRTERTRKLEEFVGALASFYRGRAEIICGNNAKTSQPVVSSSWRFDNNFEFSRYRTILAERLILLADSNVGAPTILQWVVSTARGLAPGQQEIRTSIVQKLTAHAELHEPLLKQLTDEARAVASERRGAEEKCHALAHIAESLIPLSSADADAVFQQAVDVAAQLDSEVGDQLGFLSSIVAKSSSEFGIESRGYASRTTEVVADAGIRIGENDEFPWSRSLTMIEQLDLPTALAAVARWDDSGIGDLRDTLEPVLVSAVKAKRLSIVQASALLLLEKNPAFATLQALTDASTTELEKSQLADELARDVVGERIPAYDGLEAFIDDHGSSQWVVSYRDQKSFERSLAPPEPQSGDIPSARRSDYPVWDPSTINWTQADLVDADRLEILADQALKSLRAVEQFGSLDQVLSEARKNVAAADRAAFLTALTTLALKQDNDWLVGTVMETCELWDSPAVQAWRKRELPKLMGKRVGAFCGRSYWGSERLQKAIALSCLSGAGLQNVLLEGIERSSEYLSANQMLELAEFISTELADVEAAALAKWYIERLHDRVSADVPSEDLEQVDVAALPTTSEEAVARLVAAYMTDVDVRLRWRAAHAARRLARFGDTDTFSALMDRYTSTEDAAFRAKGAPYYWLASRLWLTIACERVAEESPEFLAHHFDALFEVATGSELPHILIRDYAAQTCLKLINSGAIDASDTQLSALQSVNHATVSTTESDRYGRGFGHKSRENERFHFDTMDTLRYWYESWLRVFDDVTPEEFLESAENWIVDAWGIVDEKPYGSKEPRPQRFGSGHYGLAGNRHGSLPTLENHRKYLEWHAMWCAAGELLKTRRVAASEDDWGTIRYEVSYNRPTHPPYWLSDFSGSAPLQAHRYRCEFDDISSWNHSISDVEFIRELLPADREDWVVVDASILTKSEQWQHRTKITSSLVGSQKSLSLLRALQLAESDLDYALPAEEWDAEISDGPFALSGWLRHEEGDDLFDRKDPFRDDNGRVRMIPGTKISDFLKLRRRLNGGLEWVSGTESYPCFKYEAWGSRRENDWGRSDYLGDRVVSNGHRLLVRKKTLRTFLEAEASELIVSIGITKNDERGERKFYAEENPLEAIFERIVLLRQEGRIDAVGQDFGTWTENS